MAGGRGPRSGHARPAITRRLNRELCRVEHAPQRRVDDEKAYLARNNPDSGPRRRNDRPLRAVYAYLEYESPLGPQRDLGLGPGGCRIAGNPAARESKSRPLIGRLIGLRGVAVGGPPGMSAISSSGRCGSAPAVTGLEHERHAGHHGQDQKDPEPLRRELLQQRTVPFHTARSWAIARKWKVRSFGPDGNSPSVPGPMRPMVLDRASRRQGGSG